MADGSETSCEFWKRFRTEKKHCVNMDKMETTNVIFHITWISHHKMNLRSRGYKPSQVQTLLDPINHDKKALALTSKVKSQKEVLTFVNTFNDMTPCIRIIIHDNWKLFHTDPILKDLFPGEFVTFDRLLPPVLGGIKCPAGEVYRG